MNSPHEYKMQNRVTSPSPVLWTKELVSQLVELWVDRRTTSDMALALGVSRSAVVGKTRSLRYDLVNS